MAAHKAFQIEAPFRKACAWTQTCPSMQVLFLLHLPWYLHSPVHSALYTSSHRLRQHRPHLQLTCIHIFTDINKTTAGTDASIRS